MEHINIQILSPQTSSSAVKVQTHILKPFLLLSSTAIPAKIMNGPHNLAKNGKSSCGHYSVLKDGRFRDDI